MSARVLLVEDETALLQLLEKYLTRLGYDVESHSSAHAAFHSFAANPAVWRLVIADMSMAELPGHLLVERLFALNPDVRCLLCSGTPFDVSSLPLAIAGKTEFLLKPFLPSMLAEAVEKLLAGV
jgi:DNA-binding NtrC family response regulator